MAEEECDIIMDSDEEVAGVTDDDAAEESDPESEEAKSTQGDPEETTDSQEFQRTSIKDGLCKWHNTFLLVRKYMIASGVWSKEIAPYEGPLQAETKKREK